MRTRTDEQYPTIPTRYDYHGRLRLCFLYSQGNYDGEVEVEMGFGRYIDYGVVYSYDSHRGTTAVQ
jgi:hypothetical protein